MIVLFYTFAQNYTFRVDFVNEIYERTSVSAQSILVTQIDVGATSVDETVCVNIELEVIGFTGKIFIIINICTRRLF